jgi:hypothetical protein
MRRRALVGAAVAVLTAAAACWLWPTDARRVRGRLLTATEALSVRPGESDVERLARLAGFARSLAPDVVVQAEPGGPSVRGREAVAALASRLSTAGQQITQTDPDITFDEPRSRATVATVVRVTSDVEGPVAALDGAVIWLELVKTGDDWLIARASTEPTLAR